MRFRDPNGPWKAHPADPRLLVAREPDETGGAYWRVLPEGMIEGFDGVTIADPEALEALDLGANFPGDREAGPRALSAGPYPASEPEVAAYVAAIQAAAQHRRARHVSHVRRPHPDAAREPRPSTCRPSDRRTYDVLTARAAQLTGYDAMSYLFLRGENAETHIPSAFGWLYDQKGIYSTITEFWNPMKAAGISLAGTTASAWLWGFHPVEDELKLLRWNDEALVRQGLRPVARVRPPAARQGSRSAAGTRSASSTTRRSTASRRRSRRTRSGSSSTASRSRDSRSGPSPPRPRARTSGGCAPSSRTWAGCRRTARSRRSTARRSVRSSRRSRSRPPRASSRAPAESRSASSPAGTSSARPRRGGASIPERRIARSPSGSSRRQRATKLSITASHDRAGTARAELVLTKTR